MIGEPDKTREFWKSQVEATRRKAADWRAEAAKFAAYAWYHAALRQKYLRASDRPCAC